MNSLWNELLTIGTEFEYRFEQYMKANPNNESVTKEDHTKCLWDYTVVRDGTAYSFELKSIAGAGSDGKAYKTFCIETWANDHGKEAVRPGWYIATERGELDYVAVLNRHEGIVYLYDADLLLAYVKDICLSPGRQTRASNGGSGFVVRVPWDSVRAGLVQQFRI